jgi:hypothetical protein
MKLFKDSEVFIKERPNFITKQQKEELIKSVAKDIIKYGFYECSLSDAIEDVTDNYHLFFSNEDGYLKAKLIEDYLYAINPSSEFVEYLDGLWYKQRTILDKNVKDWVLAHDVKPKLNKGDTVEYLSSAYKITGYRLDEAKYILNETRLVEYEKIENQ